MVVVMPFLYSLRVTFFEEEVRPCSDILGLEMILEEWNLIPKHMPCSRELSSASSKAFKIPDVSASEIYLKTNFHAKQTVC